MRRLSLVWICFAALLGLLLVGCTDDPGKTSESGTRDAGTGLVGDKPPQEKGTPPDQSPLERGAEPNTPENKRTDGVPETGSPDSKALEVTPDAGSPENGPVESGPDGGQTNCGAASPPPSGAYKIMVDGKEREYHLDVPSAYDSKKRHKLIFVWHGLGGSAEKTVKSRYQGLANQNDGTAILVAGQGLLHANPLNPNGRQQRGWPDKNGEDVQFVRALLKYLQATYCIDNKKIFSTGISYGGIMTNRLGCELGDQFRAIASIMGSGPEVWLQPRCTRRLKQALSCVGKVAAWLTHGSADRLIAICRGEKSRDFWRAANNCSSQTTPVGSNGCVEYSACNKDHPVVWCPTQLGHQPPSFSGEEIWKFFTRF